MDGFGVVAYELIDIPFPLPLSIASPTHSSSQPSSFFSSSFSSSSSRPLSPSLPAAFDDFPYELFLQSANVLCVCLSVVNSDLAYYRDEVLPQIRQFSPNTAILLVGTEKDKRDSPPSPPHILGDSNFDKGGKERKEEDGKGGGKESEGDQQSKGGSVVTTANGYAFADTEHVPYCEVSTYTFEGFRTLANCGLYVAFGENLRAKRCDDVGEKDTRLSFCLFSIILKI